jgi:hypothetical protein
MQENLASQKIFRIFTDKEIKKWIKNSLLRNYYWKQIPMG